MLAGSLGGVYEWTVLPLNTKQPEAVSGARQVTYTSKMGGWELTKQENPYPVKGLKTFQTFSTLDQQLKQDKVSIRLVGTHM